MINSHFEPDKHRSSTDSLSTRMDVASRKGAKSPMTLCEQWVQDRHEPSSSFLGGILLTKLWYQFRRSDIKFFFSHYCGMVGQGKAGNREQLYYS
jgi:hypothetical protein